MSEKQPSHYINRDLSWLKFNDRVLYQAQDSRVPLLERVRFLSIFSSNLDEFFMKRLSYLKRAVQRSGSHFGGEQQASSILLNEVRKEVLRQVQARHACYEKALTPELAKNGILFLKWDDLSNEEKEIAKEYFQSKVFPVLTPLAVDKSHPFPFLSNLSVSLGLVLAHPKKGDTYFARVKVPDVLPQWVQLNSPNLKTGPKDYRLLRLSDLISSNLSELFPEMLIQSVMPFRVTRDANIDEQNDEAEDEDRLDMVEEELRLRRVAQIVRLEYVKPQDQTMLQFLTDELELAPTDLYEVPGEVSYHSLNEVASLNVPDLRYTPFSPVKPLAFRDETKDIFTIIKERDVLVHHPYESFNESVERFIRESVRDPNVLGIKITLYRAGENNPIIPLLVRAAEKGKQVVCVIELKARFDEARNIYWSEMLEDAGVHVIYGVQDKKIHAKTILVIRKENENYRFYSHLGTGNYNPNTAKQYTDLSLFTADKRIGAELIEVFNFLTGLSLKKNYQKLLVAPVNMRKRLLQYIKKEIEVKKSGQNAYIVGKMNSLEDTEICEALYEASAAGVKVDLIVRGFCTLRPKVKGLSENIRVCSTIGRFLEHSRIFYFSRGEVDPLNGKFFMGSSDWMYRNLNNRIETIVPIEELTLKAQVWHILQVMLADRLQTWDMDESGNYTLPKPERGDTKDIHETLIRYYSERRTDGV